MGRQNITGAMVEQRHGVWRRKFAVLKVGFGDRMN